MKINVDDIQSLTPSKTIHFKTILDWNREGHEKNLSELITASLLKTAMILDHDMTERKAQMIAKEWILIHRFESPEDLLLVLQNGRRGQYDVQRYGKLNLDILNQWMSLHLEEKSKAREDIHNDMKLNAKMIEGEKPFDKTEFYEKGRKFLDEQRKRDKAKKSSVGMPMTTPEEKEARIRKGLEAFTDQELKKFIASTNESNLRTMAREELTKRNGS